MQGMGRELLTTVLPKAFPALPSPLLFVSSSKIITFSRAWEHMKVGKVWKCDSNFCPELLAEMCNNSEILFVQGFEIVNSRVTDRKLGLFNII